MNFMLFVAEQLREVMASLGFRTVDEMVGHPECLRQVEVPGNWKANLLDLSSVLANGECEDVYKRQGYGNQPVRWA